MLVPWNLHKHIETGNERSIWCCDALYCTTICLLLYYHCTLLVFTAVIHCTLLVCIHSQANDTLCSSNSPCTANSITLLFFLNLFLRGSSDGASGRPLALNNVNPTRTNNYTSDSQPPSDSNLSALLAARRAGEGKSVGVSYLNQISYKCLMTPPPHLSLVSPVLPTPC